MYLYIKECGLCNTKIGKNGEISSYPFAKKNLLHCWYNNLYFIVFSLEVQPPWISRLFILSFNMWLKVIFSIQNILVFFLQTPTWSSPNHHSPNSKPCFFFSSFRKQIDKEKKQANQNKNKKKESHTVVYFWCFKTQYQYSNDLRDIVFLIRDEGVPSNCACFS